MVGEPRAGLLPAGAFYFHFLIWLPPFRDSTLSFGRWKMFSFGHGSVRDF
jgi:hypothetical protein